jgi:signal transduction histidine kinase
VIQYEDQQIADLFDAQPQPVFYMKPVWDKQNDTITDFEYTYCNEEMYSFVGMSKDCLLGNRLSTTLTLNDDLKARVLNEIREVYQTGKRLQSRFYNERLKKYYSYIRSKVQDGVMTVMQDRTAEYIMIKELEHKNRLLDNILKHSNSGIAVSKIIKDEAGNLVDSIPVLANDAAIKISGCDQEDFYKKTSSELYAGFATSPVFKLAENSLKTGEPFQFEYFHESVNKWLELSVSKMDDEHLISVATDITSVKQAQLNTEKIVEELKKSNASLEEFAHAASHDLKEPIRKIQFFSSRLKEKLDSKLDNEDKRWFERMDNATERMSLLIDDLLAYSHASHRIGQVDQIDMNGKMTKILMDLEIAIEEKSAKITYNKLPVIKGYRRQIQQLFQNLISNAIKYSKPDTAPEITITASVVNGSEIEAALTPEQAAKQYHLFEVKDNGIGFEQEYAERIFNMFQRLHGKAEYSGTGIGLSIVRKVAENHNGFVIAKGEPDVGSTFNVYLPVE